MTRRTHAAFLLAALLMSLLSVGAAHATTSFLQTHYYLLSLGPIASDAESIQQAVQSSGYSVILYDGDTAQGYRGGDPIAPEAVSTDAQLLIVDRERILLRGVGDGFAFTVRPSDPAYELVIDPLRDLAVSDVLGAVLGELQSLGVLGHEANLNIDSFRKDDPKGPPPPADVAIESTLYSLLIARDWFDYAASVGLTLSGLRVEVVAEIDAGASLDAAFTPYVIEEAEGLVKLSLPIDRLLALARSGGVSYVRTPYRPSVP